MAAPIAPAGARAGRLARYEHVLALHQQGWTQTAIAAQVGLSQPTIRKYLRAGSFPEWGPRRTVLRPGTRLGEYLRARWQAGVQEAMQLWQELRARGYRGTARSVQRTVAPWREGPALRGHHARRLQPPRAAAPDQRPPSARQAAWLLLRPLDALTVEEQHLRQRVLAATPEIEQAHTAIRAFRRLLRERDGEALEPWLAQAQGSAVRELRAFAASLRKDQAAVQAALDYPWSSGRVEGHITRIKLVKRQMYGRGSVDLLKRRVMLAS